MPRLSARLVGALGLACCLATATAQVTTNSLSAAINAQLAAEPGNTWGVLVQNDTGTITYIARSPTTLFRPASNTKMFTTAGAFGLLGPTHIWNGQQLQYACEPINTNSDNALADSLLTYVGQVKAGSATYSAGAAQVLAWCSGIGLNMTGAVMQDGSGLDYDNRFSPVQTVSLVRYMFHNYPTWDDTLSVACVNGTLAGRFCGTPLSARLYGKTGTLPNGLTVALSGYFVNPTDSRRYYFSMYANTATDVAGTRAAMDAALQEMDGSGIPNDGPGTFVVVENGGAGYAESGTWTTSSSFGYHGSDSRFATTLSGATATFTPTLPLQGEYDVYAWYVSGTNRNASTTYAVNHAIGTQAYVVDQTANGGRWNLLGRHPFRAGSSGNVVMQATGESSKVVIADAVQFIYRGTTNAIPPVSNTLFVR